MFVHSKSEKNERTQSAAAGHARRSKKKMGSSLAAPVQTKPDETAPVQGKFPIQTELEDKEEAVQSKLSAQKSSEQSPLSTGSGIPESVQTKMEGALNTSLSGVTVHPNSSQATKVGALAYTRGTDIHVAPGHYSPNTSSGKKLLGHELTHVAQQMAGQVRPTGEVGGLPLNDNPALEKEADSKGAKAV